MVPLCVTFPPSVMLLVLHLGGSAAGADLLEGSVLLQDSQLPNHGEKTQGNITMLHSGDDRLLTLALMYTCKSCIMEHII